jgi:hypothetical protein
LAINDPQWRLRVISSLLAIEGFSINTAAFLDLVYNFPAPIMPTEGPGLMNWSSIIGLLSAEIGLISAATYSHFPKKAANHYQIQSWTEKQSRLAEENINFRKIARNAIQPVDLIDRVFWAQVISI